MADSRPRTPRDSLTLVDSTEHASMVIRSLRSVLSSQKRYQTGSTIGRSAFDNLVTKAKNDADEWQDLAERAERALVSGVSADPMRHKEGALQAKPIPQVANKVAISINSKQSNSKQPSKADVMSKVDYNSSSDDDIDMHKEQPPNKPTKESATLANICQDDPSIYGLPLRSANTFEPTTKHCSTVPAQDTKIKGKAHIAPSSCTDDPSIYGIPRTTNNITTQPARGITAKAVSIAKVPDDIDFSSDEEGIGNKYTNFMDAPPVLPDDDMMCGAAKSKGYEDEEAELSNQQKQSISGSTIIGKQSNQKAPVANNQRPVVSAGKAVKPTIRGDFNNPVRSSSAGGNSPQRSSGHNAPSRKKKMASGDFSDDERDDDELDIEHDLFGGDDKGGISNSPISYSDAVKKTAASNVTPGATKGVFMSGRQKPPPKNLTTTSTIKKTSTSRGSATAEDSDHGKRAIIKPGQGIKVVRGGKKSVR